MKSYLLILTVLFLGTSCAFQQKIIIKKIDKSVALINSGHVEKGNKLAKKLYQNSDKYKDRYPKAYAFILENAGVVFLHEEKFQKALDLFLEADTILPKKTSEDSLFYAKHLNNLCQSYLRLGAYEKALEKVNKSIKIKKDITGISNISYCLSLSNKATILMILGRLEEAVVIQKEAVEKAKVIKDENKHTYCKILTMLGTTYQFMGDLEQAQSIYEEAIIDFDQLLEKPHPVNVIIRTSLGNVYIDLGYLDKAYKILKEGEEIGQKYLPDEHSEVINNAASLCKLCIYTGQSDKAIRIAEKSIEALEANPKKKGLEYIVLLQNLGTAYLEKEAFHLALPKLLKTKAIIERNSLQGNLTYRSLLNNIGTGYYALGQYEKANDFLKNTPAYYKNKEKKYIPVYATSLTSYGSNLYKINKIDSALVYFNKAEAFYENGSLNKLSSNYAVLQIETAKHFYHEKKFNLALTKLLNAKKILDSIEIKSHSSTYYNIALNLALVYDRLNQKNKATEYFRYTINQGSKHLGNDHPIMMDAYNNYSKTFETSHQIDSALFYKQKMLDNLKFQIKNSFTVLSEEGKQGFIAKNHGILDEFNSFAFRNSSDQRFGAIIYNNLLAIKGIQLSNTKTVQQNILNSQNKDLKNKFQKVRDLRQMINKQISEPIIDERFNIDSLQKEAEAIESELIIKSAPYQKILKNIEWKEVQENLEEGEAHVEFVHFNYTDIEKTDSVLYAAIILTKEVKRPVFIPLFEKSELEEMINFDAVHQKSYVKAVYFDYKKRKVPLHQKIWQPIEPYLTGIKKVYYSPSGILHKVSFSLISDKKDSLISDKFDLVYIPNSRALVFKKNKMESLPKTSILLGDINYDADSIDLVNGISSGSAKILNFFNNLKSNAEIPSLPMAKKTSSIEQMNKFFSTEKFKEILDIGNLKSANSGSLDTLKNSKTEMELMQSLFRENNISSLLLSRNEAAEENFKLLQDLVPSPDIIYFSTHGFFIENAKTDERYKGFWTASNPLFRSGLALTAANKMYKYQSNYLGYQDGILTAFDISNMDLSGTQLVILSACDTGKGDIDNSEGVYGLQRAFKMAGVDHILMTLWKIPDNEQTILFLHTFYSNWFKGLTIEKAFQKTQRDLKNELPPQVWGAFVLI